jgi:predicted DNA-binding transcriptional regulator AlpA
VIDADRYLTTEELAELTRTSPETVRWWRYMGKGPESFKVGRRVLYDRTVVEKWLRTAQGQK